MAGTPTIMAPASRFLSAQRRAGYPGQIRSRNCGQRRFLPVTTHCTHRLSRYCVAPVAMCCIGPQPRMLRGTLEPTTNDVSATPTVVGDAVYFPDWGGNL